MLMDRKTEKKDDDDTALPFQDLDKGIVLQEKRLFNETPLNPRKCCQLLTKLLYLVYQGESFTKIEATDLFFAVTKLFQSKDIPLRRMVYLVLKELTPIADDVIIVMSSLTKDMNSKTDLYRANAMRVLTGVTDNTLLGQIERYLKQAIVDREPFVASAALVSGVHLMRTSSDIIKRWINEVQEALQSKSMMVQYHALGLLHQIKQHDRLALSKLVQSMIKSSIRSSYAHCLLIQFTAQVMEEDSNAAEKGFFSYLESCLRHKSDMVVYEAARAICSLKKVTSRELTPAITVLQLLLSSPKAPLRFAAVRTLNKVAQNFPLAVVTCNLDMESLITDSNRSIATLAITTLLKTGNEMSVERLMKHISGFLSEISDEFKIVIVNAIKELCLKFPRKQKTLLGFLSVILRDEGGFEYKKAIVETILSIINELPDAKDAGMTYLCEFIEDCEFTYLSTKILYLLGNEGPATAFPSRYIRYIYNRVSLENAPVRAAAVSALAKFGVKLESLRPSIVVLLKRCLNDTDDEVRDRATLYVHALEKAPLDALSIIEPEFKIPWINLESSLQQYQKNPSTQPFDIQSVPLVVSIEPSSSKKGTTSSSGKISIGPIAASDSSTSVHPVTAKSSDNIQEQYRELLASISQFSKLGELFKSSATPVDLTESETEYVVSCVKHVFPQHIVFQFNCVNTMKDQLLENVTVKMDVSSAKGVKIDSVFPLARLPFETPGSTFVCIQRPEDSFSTGTFSNTLKFSVKEVDLQTGEAEDVGNEDEYQLEDIELTTSDYMQKAFIPNFQEKWEQLGDEFEVIETYSLSSAKSLQGAVNDVISYLGMQTCDRSEQVPPKKNKHILYLCGNFIGNILVLVRSRMKFTEGQGVQMEITVRSTNDDVSTAVAGAI